MIKALFFDIDGTLVSFKTHRIPQSAIDAIHRVRQQGVKVFIATGRPLPFVGQQTDKGIVLTKNLEGLEYDGIMCVNGAYCITAAGEVISKQPVCRDDIQRLVDNHKINPMPIAFANNDGAMLCDIDAARKQVEDVFTLLDIPLPKPSAIEDALNVEVMQVIAFFPKEEEGRVMKELLPHCDSNRWHKDFTDCISKGTNKGTGIDAIISHYGIAIDETMAFGDGGNDIEMLRHAGVGVAMGNALDVVKENADIVTTSVDDDGIANILNKYFA